MLSQKVSSSDFIQKCLVMTVTSLCQANGSMAVFPLLCSHNLCTRDCIVLYWIERDLSFFIDKWGHLVSLLANDYQLLEPFSVSVFLILMLQKSGSILLSLKGTWIDSTVCQWLLCRCPVGTRVTGNVFVGYDASEQNVQIKTGEKTDPRTIILERNRCANPEVPVPSLPWHFWPMTDRSVEFHDREWHDCDGYPKQHKESFEEGALCVFRFEGSKVYFDFSPEVFYPMMQTEFVQ